MKCSKCGAKITPNDSHECNLPKPELTSEMKGLLEEYIKENLTIHLEGSRCYLVARLELCGRTISHDEVEIQL